MKDQKSKALVFNREMSIILTGGGTAGHVWPHFALFEAEHSPLAIAFQNKILKVHYMGSQEGMEKELVKSTQPCWNYHAIATGKLRRYFSIRNFTDPFRILYGFIQAFFLIQKIKPAIVFSKGGFVSVPVVWAAWILGIPIVIHESDATPALATKLTLPCSTRALTAFPETIQLMPSFFKSRVLYTGLPIRDSLFSANRLESLNFFNLPADKKTLLIFGGSLGAQSLNEKIFSFIEDLHAKYNIIHLTGKGKKKTFLPPLQNYRQFEFLKEDMKFAYGAADVSLCRAGASSIFELAAARIPMILIPLSLEASRGDQIINARIFAQHGWADCCEESALTPEKGMDLINSCMDKLTEKKEKLSTAPSKEAAKQIAELLWVIMLRYEDSKKR